MTSPVRIPTLAGERLGDLSAVVVVTDESTVNGVFVQAVCACCGWDIRQTDSMRNDVVETAQDHADRCRALPPNDGQSDV